MVCLVEIKRPLLALWWVYLSFHDTSLAYSICPPSRRENTGSDHLLNSLLEFSALKGSLTRWTLPPGALNIGRDFGSGHRLDFLCCCQWDSYCHPNPSVLHFSGNTPCSSKHFMFLLWLASESWFLLLASTIIHLPSFRCWCDDRLVLMEVFV